MCGIFGVVTSPGKSWRCDRLGEISEILRHRGPDDHGWLTWREGKLRIGRETPSPDISGVLLLHRRLSILDLSETGWQPMLTPDGRYAIVFNGEIYNYVELREELEKLGCQFKSHSDTEVLLHGLACWGKPMLRRLVGMFAFALLDMRENRLLLARDFFGIKPLYYARFDHGLAFSSEIRPLLLLPGVQRQLEPQAVFDFLRSGLTDHGTGTLLQSIHLLPPAHWVEVSLDRPGELTPERYWQVELEPRQDISFEDAAAKLRELFLRSVQIHLRSDVPIGSALSGGIDSSSIVACIRHLQGKNVEMHSFSFIAEEADVCEEKWVDIAAKAAGAHVHKTRATPQELVDDLDHLVAAQDEPFGSTSIYAQHRVFRLARENGIKVMLDGQGADEMLGGYRGYLPSRVASLLRRGRALEAANFVRQCSRFPGVNLRGLGMETTGLLLPKGLHRFARRLAGRPRVPPWLNEEWFAERGVDYRPCPPAVLNPDLLRQTLLQTLTQTSLPMLLRYEDRNSMAFSIESRVPFLTPDLAQFILTLPEHYLVARDGTTKAVFRAAMRGIVPDAILDRRDKIGFATPELSWLETLRPWVERVLQSETARSLPMLNLPVISAEWKNILARRTPFDFRVWRWVNLIRWCERLELQN
ncbi:MAG TPA: asparagine synthase (glutamine-hydrolyzing) [Planctomycetota bacterium]|jgi:asparagine synthase (glutamine-hydrolysing)